MNILSEMTIAAISPPSTRSEVQKTGDGDRSFQGELDVKMKVTQETQKQNTEKEKGTDVLAGAGAVTPQSTPVVILSEILKLAAQAASSQPNMATINAALTSAEDLISQQTTPVAMVAETVIPEIPVLPPTSAAEPPIKPDALLKPVVPAIQPELQSAQAVTSTVGLDPNLKIASMDKIEVVNAPVQVEKTVIPTESMVSSENKAQLLAYNNALSSVDKTTQVQQAPIMQQVIDGIKKMTDTGQSTLRLQINPESLGRIEVKLVSGTDGMQIFITADKSATNRLLETNVAQLQQSLLDAGVKIGGMNVGQQQNQGNYPTWQSFQTNTSSYSTNLGGEDQGELIGHGALGLLSALDARV